MWLSSAPYASQSWIVPYLEIEYLHKGRNHITSEGKEDTWLLLNVPAASAVTHYTWIKWRGVPASCSCHINCSAYP